MFNERFGRERLDPLDDRFTLWQRFDVEGYLDYHGAKLARRFDANTYLVHQPGHGPPRRRPRPGRHGARPSRRIAAPVLTLGIDSDILYPAVPAGAHPRDRGSLGGDATHVEIDSPHGHDAFLLETDAVGDALLPFLSQIEKGDR